MEQFESNAFTDLDDFMSKSNFQDLHIEDDSFEDSYQYADLEDDYQDPDPDNKPERTDFVANVLKKHGIDVNAISIQNEEGEEEIVSFDDLTEDEKMELYELATESSITDSELEAINTLRKNQMNLSDMIQWQREEAVKEYLAQSSHTQYKIDELKDDDLYVFDLHERYPDMTDEELVQDLEFAKQNEALFNKKITALRTEYKQLEDENIELQRQQASQQAEQEFNMLAQSLVDVARNTNELHDLIIEDEDKEAVLSFLLDRDANGQSQFYKLFEDPQKLFELAWYAKFGKQAFLDVNDYYKKVIEKTRRGDTPSPKVARRTAVKRSPADKYDLEGQFANI